MPVSLNISKPAIYTRLYPQISPKDESESKDTTIANWYAFTIQIDIDGVASKSPAIDGNATLAIVPSNTDTVIPMAIAKIAQYRLGTGIPSHSTSFVLISLSIYATKLRNKSKLVANSRYTAT